MSPNFHGRKFTEEQKRQIRESGRNKAERNGRWNGGRYVSNGYVFVRVGTGKYRLEQIVEAEKMLGRPLTSTERVHHLTEDKTDNAHDNLFVCASDSIHAKIHREYSRVLAKLLPKQELRAIAERVAKARGS
jgi:hypothetical protein